MRRTQLPATWLAAAAGLVRCQDTSTPAEAPDIIKWTMRGTGCDSGTVVSATQNDVGSYQFGSFNAMLGPDAPSIATAQLCLVQLTFEDIPDGHAMVIKDLVVDGEMHLEPGASAFLQTLPFWAGMKTRLDQNQTWTADAAGEALVQPFSLAYPGDMADDTTSSCDPTLLTQPDLNINVQAKLSSNSQGATGTFSVHSLRISTELVSCPGWSPAGSDGSEVNK